MSAFLSTLSLRRATSTNEILRYLLDISIHALLAESDPWQAPAEMGSSGFLSTLSLRRATRAPPTVDPLERTFLSTLSLRRATENSGVALHDLIISIHALLAESDACRSANKGTP